MPAGGARTWPTWTTSRSNTCPRAQSCATSSNHEEAHETTGSTQASPIVLAAALRSAVESDFDVICSIWHRGWRDAHLGHVPAALYRHRRLDDFRELVPAQLDTTTVATVDGRVVGFVTVHADEIEQLYVDAAARGTDRPGRRRHPRRQRRLRRYDVLLATA